LPSFPVNNLKVEALEEFSTAMLPTIKDFAEIELFQVPMV
jgi:hypothetical protein